LIFCQKKDQAFHDTCFSQNSEFKESHAGVSIRELCQLGNYYKQQLKARITRRKNKTEHEDESLIQPEKSTA
jgi:hypothetical protein